MRDLRQAREERALGLRQVSEATGIPVDILVSLEAEPDAQIKPGSTIARWRAEYEAFLLRHAPAPEPAERPIDAPERTETTTALSGAAFRSPHGVGRALGWGLAVAILAALGLEVFSFVLDRPDATAPPPEPADERPIVHRLGVRAIEPSRLKVEVDGVVLHDGVLAPRQSLEFTARERLAVEVPDLTRVRMRYNDRALTPLGNLSARRRLVFIDDEGP